MVVAFISEMIIPVSEVMMDQCCTGHCVSDGYVIAVICVCIYMGGGQRECHGVDDYLLAQIIMHYQGGH